AGHNITDALLAAMLHQAFLTGVQYELKEKGEITGELFEVLNTRFFNSSSLSKFITLIYGEIYEGGRFRFLNAGHPPPVIFSNRMDKLINICKQRVAHYPPIGTLPPKDDIDPGRHFSRLGYKKKYSVNQINLMGTGDILLLYTDGFSEHSPDMETFFLKHRLEGVLQKIKHGSARDIFCGIKEEMFKFAEAGDDISFVVIKRV
ncbi:MAG: serine/threonine-protein phosphatase, partial [bacterium]|nr:serine/threonine-protein phosphatase [bacterium]